jgi:hypothetical protein
MRGGINNSTSLAKIIAPENMKTGGYYGELQLRGKLQILEAGI